jgi:transcription initiation factor TFIIB
MRTWDARSRLRTPTHRNLLIAFSELSRLKDKLGLSSAIVEKTAYIYRKAQEKKLIRGRSIYSILSAAIYIACRELGAARSLTDVIKATSIKRKSLSKCYRILVHELDLKVPLVDHIKCTTVIANRAGLGERTKRMAVDLMREVVDNGISAGKDPMCLAATVLYVSCHRNGEDFSQKEIAKVAGVTEVTIRNRIKELRAKLYPNLEGVRLSPW